MQCCQCISGGLNASGTRIFISRAMQHMHVKFDCPPGSACFRKCYKNQGCTLHSSGVGRCKCGNGPVYTAVDAAISHLTAAPPSSSVFTLFALIPTSCVGKGSDVTELSLRSFLLVDSGSTFKTTVSTMDSTVIAIAVLPHVLSRQCCGHRFMPGTRRRGGHVLRLLTRAGTGRAGNREAHSHLKYRMATMNAYSQKLHSAEMQGSALVNLQQAQPSFRRVALRRNTRQRCRAALAAPVRTISWKLTNCILATARTIKALLPTCFGRI